MTSVHISREAYEAQVTERDVRQLQVLRAALTEDVKQMESELRNKKDRIMAITASLALIQLTLEERLNHGTARTA